MINESRDAFTCQSSTLKVLADSGPFRGILLTVLGPGVSFPRLTNRGVRLRVSHQHSQFWPILSCFMGYYSLFWGPGVIPTINEPRGALTCR